MIVRAAQNMQVTPASLDHRIETADQNVGPNISPARLADYWGVHVRTIYRDIHKGALRAFKLPGGQIRIRTSDARRYGKPVE